MGWGDREDKFCPGHETYSLGGLCVVGVCCLLHSAHKLSQYSRVSLTNLWNIDIRTIYLQKKVFLLH